MPDNKKKIGNINEELLQVSFEEEIFKLNSDVEKGIEKNEDEVKNPSIDSLLDLDTNSDVVIQDANFISDISTRINETIRFICENIVGRQEIVKQTFFAFITGEHQLLLGRTGMAKSLMARQIFECFENTTVYEKQLTKDTMPDNLFGAYDIGEMKQGKMFHNINGSIVTSDFAFLDEIFDANDMLLRSLLSLLNERKLINGEQIINSPLNSVIAASNYIRVTEMLEAVLDRFLYKSYIPENKNLYYQFSIDQIYGKNVGNVKPVDKKIDLLAFKELKNIIKSKTIQIPDYILFLKNYILRQFIDETNKMEDGCNYTISDRTGAKVQDLLRASAILDNRLEANEDDFNNLYYLICMVGKENEKTRLQNIIDTTKRYFSQDKELLYRIFNLINVFNTVKTSKDPVSLVQHQNFIFLVNKIEQSFKETSITNRIKHFISKMSFRPNRSKLYQILEIFSESCCLLRDMATKKESIELIEGFENDIDIFSKSYSN